MLYLDNNATTQPSPAAAAAAHRASTQLWANPSSIHRLGQAVRREIELARQSLADLIGAKPREIVLTSGGTESIDLCLKGVLDALPRVSPRRTLLTTRAEHAAIRDLAEALDKDVTSHPVTSSPSHPVPSRPLDLPPRVTYLPLTAGGVINLASLEAALDRHAALVSIQWANNETGVLQPIAEISKLCRSRNVLFHCDATQWAGKGPIPSTDPFDLLTFSPHKFHGVKGVGVAWLRPGVRVRPQLLGAQELGRRGGTENVPAILAAGVAAREALDFLRNPDATKPLEALRDRFEEAILTALPDASINSRAHPRLWNTSNIGFPRLEAEALLMLLSERGLCASAGAACSSGSLEPSPVLLAMGIPEEIAHGSIRFSLSRHTTEPEINEAAAIVIDSVRKLRASMP